VHHLDVQHLLAESQPGGTGAGERGDDPHPRGRQLEQAVEGRHVLAHVGDQGRVQLRFREFGQHDGLALAVDPAVEERLDAVGHLELLRGVAGGHGVAVRRRASGRAGCRAGARRRSGCGASVAGRMSWRAGGGEQSYRDCQAGHASRQPTAPRGARTEPDHACLPKPSTIRREYISREYAPFMVASRSGAHDRARQGRVRGPVPRGIRRAHWATRGQVRVLTWWTSPQGTPRAAWWLRMASSSGPSSRQYTAPSALW